MPITRKVNEPALARALIIGVPFDKLRTGIGVPLKGVLKRIYRRLNCRF